MAEQADALGSNPGSSKEYEFDSHQGDHHNERRTSMKLRQHIHGSCELAQEAQLHGLEANETDPWDTALDAILWSASDQRSEEDLDKALSWALVDKTA